MLLSKVSLGQYPGFDERAGKSGEVTKDLPGVEDQPALHCRLERAAYEAGSCGRKECESGRSLLFKHSGKQRRGFYFQKMT